jgi:hypothetical protein
VRNLAEWRSTRSAFATGLKITLTILVFPSKLLTDCPVSGSVRRYRRGLLRDLGVDQGRQFLGPLVAIPGPIHGSGRGIHELANPEAVRDIVIGMSDGLTVPFALAAGLSGAVEVTGIIITVGLAEVAAGAIAMGLCGLDSRR